MTAFNRSRFSLWLCISAFLVQLGMASAQVGPAYLVADIDNGVRESQFNPIFYAELDGRLYFAGHTSGTGHELFRTDGTPEGTDLVADLCAGSCSSQGIFSNASAVFEGELYFGACALLDCRLWKTDGDVVSPVFEAGVLEILAHEGALYVTTVDGEVRRTDGQGAGTLLFQAGATPISIVPGAEGLYVWARGIGGLTVPLVDELWYTDGTVAGSRLIHAAGGGNLELFSFVFDGRVLFAAEGRLWLADPFGSEPLFADSPFTRPRVVGEADGGLFVLDDFRQLWRTDGTLAGTTLIEEAMVRDETDPAGDFFVILSQAHEGELYFSHRDGSRFLFRTTGGVGKTALYEFPDSVQNLQVVGDTLYVVTGFRSMPFYSSLRSSTLWRVEDGSVPVQVATLADGESFGEDVVRYQDFLAFERRNPNGIGVVSHLATVDVAGGEVVVLGWPESGASSDPRELTRDRDRVLFRPFSAFDNFQSWTSDGTEKGTVAVRESVIQDSIVQAGDEAFIRTSGLNRALGLYQVDEDGDLKQVFEAPAREVFVNEDAIVINRGVLLFTETAARLLTLYLGDRDTGALEVVVHGLHRFTGIIRDLVQSASLEEGVLLILDEQVVWRTDGTPGGTTRVLDITDFCVCTLTNPVRVGDRVYFISRSQQEVPRLWASDGSPKGTFVVREFQPAGADDQAVPVLHGLTAADDRLFFVLQEPELGAELWTSDGTARGTTLVRDLKVGPGSSHPRDLTAVKVTTNGPKEGNHRLFFSADDGVHGRELWTSDGSVEGTAQVLDLWPGRRGSDPRELTVAFGQLVFTADDGVHGAEPWTSDGRAVSTRMIQDIQPGTFPSDPHSFISAGELVFFSAWKEETGAELWALPGAALFEPLVGSFEMPAVAVVNKPVVMRDVSTGVLGTWCWIFGDREYLDVCQGATPVVAHAYAVPGFYQVTLLVHRTLPDGRTQSAESSQMIEVRPLQTSHRRAP